MDENEVTVDVDKLRALANRIDDGAKALRTFQFTGIEDELPGAAVAAVVSPTVLTPRLDPVLAGAIGWSVAARTAAAHLDDADGSAAHRVGRP
jgi:hypothetical protein